MVRNSEIIIPEAVKEDETGEKEGEENENKENEEVDSKDANITQNANKNKGGKKKKRKNKIQKNESKYFNEQSQKVKRMRDSAARLCRANTPFKNKLRSHKH